MASSYHITQNDYIYVNMIGVSWSKPYASESFVLSAIHKRLQIKIRELANALACAVITSTPACVMVHDMANLMM